MFKREFLNTALPFPRGVPHDHWLSVLAAARGELQVVRAPLILYRRHLGVASLTGLARRISFIDRSRALAATFCASPVDFQKRAF